MKIGLHDAEKEHFRGKKKFPNYALMKLSAYHKARGDSVEWWDSKQSFDRVYSSKTFNFTPVNPSLPADAIKGGTGYIDIPLRLCLSDEIDAMYPDYTIYPECDYAIGYITRGCPNHCRWCDVPLKEGQIRPYADWRNIIRPDTKKLVLMDNNILASEYGIRQLAELAGTDYRIDLNQGMDARLVTPDIAGIISSLKWMRFIRFSCDTLSQIDAIDSAVEMLGRRGIRPYRIFVYLLVTQNLADAAYRVERLKRYRGINLYAQPERNGRLGISPGKMQMEFAQRYIYSGCYRKETWEEYCRRKEFIEEDNKKRDRSHAVELS